MNIVTIEKLRISNYIITAVKRAVGLVNTRAVSGNPACHNLLVVVILYQVLYQMHLWRLIYKWAGKCNVITEIGRPTPIFSMLWDLLLIAYESSRNLASVDCGQYTTK